MSADPGRADRLRGRSVPCGPGRDDRQGRRGHGAPRRRHDRSARQDRNADARPARARADRSRRRPSGVGGSYASPRRSTSSRCTCWPRRWSSAQLDVVWSFLCPPASPRPRGAASRQGRRSSGDRRLGWLARGLRLRRRRRTRGQAGDRRRGRARADPRRRRRPPRRDSGDGATACVPARNAGAGSARCRRRPVAMVTGDRSEIADEVARARGSTPSTPSRRPRASSPSSVRFATDPARAPS